MLILRIALIIMVATPTIGFSQTGTKTAKELIQVRAIVTNRQGQLVDSLTKEDFLFKEDDLPQPLDFFSVEKVEGKRGSLTTPQSEAALEIPEGAPGNIARPAFSRVLVLLIDTVSISHSGLESLRRALKGFIDEQVTDQDLIAVMTTAGKPGVTGEFTKDHSRLQEGIKKVRPGRVQSESFLMPALCGKVSRRVPEAVALATQIIDSEERTTGSLLASESSETEAASKCMMILLEASSRRKACISAIRAAAEKLAAMPGQRIIALFSEGFSMTAPGGEVAIADIRPAISSAVRAGVMVYAFDTRVVLDTKPINIGSLHLTSEMQDSVRDFQHGVALLASQTGGESFFNVDGLSDQMQKMLDSNRVYYQLAYSPSLDKDPRAYRNITVSVKNHPEYRVRAPKGYVLSDLRGFK